jgi:hypothetical protein
VNSAGDGHDSRCEGDAKSKVLIVRTILAYLFGGSFVQVRGWLGRAIEIVVVDEATMEFTVE